MYKIFHFSLAAVAFIVSPIFVLLTYDNSFYIHSPASIAVTQLAVLNVFFIYIDCDGDVFLKRLISISLLIITVLAIVSLFFASTFALLLAIIWLVIVTALVIIISSGITIFNRKPREQGVVKWFNVSKGFGFITRDSGEDVFVHFRAIRNKRIKSLREGQRVEFYVADHEKGPQAQSVSVLPSDTN